MKKKSILIITAALIILCTMLCACAEIFQDKSTDTGSVNTDKPSTSTSNDAKIKELEAQILSLLQSQQLSESERKQEIAELNAEIEKLKKPEQTQKPNDTEEPKKDTAPIESFKYTLENGKAVITEISTLNESVTIPAVIDGYKVYSIGSDALSSSTVKSVVISDGIEKLDWFAFRGCLSLSSVNIPNSIASIGYGAFDNTAKSLTILCSRDSFAHQYAQSYGLTYDIT